MRAMLASPWLAGAVATMAYAVARITRSLRADGVTAVMREPAVVVMLGAAAPRRASPMRNDTAESGDGRAIGAIAVSFIVGLAAPLMDPVAALRRIDREFLQVARHRDDALFSAPQRTVRDAMVPTAALAPGMHRLQVWVRFDAGATWIRLGDPVEFDLRGGRQGPGPA